MLINKVLPGLFNGVSQQPAALRLDTQCELSENVFPSLAEGASKRPPTEHLAVLSSNASATSFVHTINRDSGERYIVILTGDATEPVEIYTMDGVKCTVVADAAGKAYLTAANPLTSFKATTVADYTLIANTTKKCLMSSVVSPVDKPTAIVYVAKGVASQVYNIYLNGSLSASYASLDTTFYESYKSTTIAWNLYTQLLTLTSNQLAMNFAGAEPSGPIQVTVAGVPLGVPVSPIYDTIAGGEGESYTAYNAEATAQAVYSQINSTINNVQWGVFLVGSMIYIKRYGYSTFTYSITGGVSSVAPNTSSQWDVDYIGGQNVIRIMKLDGTDFAFSASDTYNNQALISIKGKAQKFGDLPPVCWDGMRVEITGEPSNQFDNFHLQYSTNEGQSVGVWKEVVKQGLKDVYDASTMPHQLIRSGVNTFTLSPITWLDRRAGDDDSNPPASFIDSYIKDIFFYRNRLGFLAGENVILSKAGEFFDFWSNTATTVLDNDPIDISCPTNEVTELLHAIPFPKSLFLVGAQQQFSLNSGSLNMTPKTVAVDAVTHYEVSPLVSPVVAGANVYMPVPKGNYTSLREYFISADSFSTDAADITAHVPTYIPKNVSSLTASSAFDLLFALSQDEPDTLYTYKYYWSGDQKAQSAWGKWKIDGAIIGCSLLSNYLFLVVRRGTEVTLERIRLEQVTTGSLTYRVHLDRLVSVTGVYDAVLKKTTWTLPYSDPSDAYTIVKSTDGFPVRNSSRTSYTTLEAPGDFSGSPCWIGRRYTKRYRFTEWKVKAQGTNVGVLQGRLQVRNLTLGFYNTGHFQVEVTPHGRGSAVYSYDGATLGVSKINEVPLVSADHRFLIMTRAEDATIDIVNDSHLPSCFHTASYEGFFTVRSRTY